MAARKETHYDVLGVPRDAKLTEITRAYNRHKAEVTREDAPPDLKRETLIREAYETLADETKRDAYDRSLVAPDRRVRSRTRAIVIGAVGVTIAGAALVFLRPKGDAPVKPRATQEILNDASISVGELQAIDMSGKSTSAGLAFAIGEDVLVGTCRDVTPASQVVVNIAARQATARVLAVDDQLGLCRLLARGVGSRPLDAARTDPKAGDLVYATRLDPAGKVVLAQGTVKRVLFEPSKVIESAAEGPSGGPLLDTQGQVVGVATGSGGRYIPLPPAWVTEARQPFVEERFAPPPTPSPPPADAGAPGAPSPPPNTKALESITPDQRQRLEKAYRPPPDTKDDWQK